MSLCSIWTPGSQSQSSFSPQFLLNRGRDNPTPLRVSLWKHQRRQRTRPDLVFPPNGGKTRLDSTKACFACYASACNSRTLIQITKKCTTLALQCAYIHTRMWQSKIPPVELNLNNEQSLTLPLMTIYGANSESARLSFHFFQRRAGYLVFVLHLTSFLATGGP